MADASCKIVVAERISSHALQRLREAGEVLQLDSCDQVSLHAAVADCDALVVRSYTHVSDSIIHAAPKLKVIGRAGVGVENIDTAAAAAAGVVVVHTPAASTQAVAELTIGLMVALERRVFWAGQQLQQGRFKAARNELASRQLGEMTLGIIGFGRIGQRVATIARHGFGMKIVWNDIRDVESPIEAAAAVSKAEIYTNADVISLHVPFTDQTRHLIDAAALSKVKRTTLLINTARGAVVDTRALSEMLHAGRIAGAAVDVFDPEPPPPDHPLLSAPHCILTPHIGSRTQASLAAMNDVVEDVIAVLQNRTPQYPYEG